MSKFIKLLLYCITLLLVTGQAQKVSSQEATPQVAVEASNILEGTVVETMNAGGYTYVCIENNGQTSWAATRGTVEVGEEVEIASGSVMTNFTSESLGRTFDTIIFTNRIVKR